MGICYYGWPLRSELDFVAAINDPCSASRAIDKREAARNPDNCTGLDKAHTALYQYFTIMPGDAHPPSGPAAKPDEREHVPEDVFDTRCECVDDLRVTIMPRPGALLLREDPINRWSPEGFNPYFGIISPVYVQLAAHDYLTVDLDELEADCARDFGAGSYYRSQFEQFRETIHRFAAEEAGFLYMIG